MGLPQSLPVFTTDEYLALERASEVRHEFVDGFVYAMAGEIPEHSTICFNLAVAVGRQIKDGPCRGFSPNMKVRTDPAGLFAYPDLMVVCGEPLFHDDRRDVLVNPTVIFEVLSPSTEAYDRGEKFLRYRTRIAALRDYVLVSQGGPLVEHFGKQQDGSWSLTEVRGISGILHLPSIACELPLIEVYNRVVFPVSDKEASS